MEDSNKYFTPRAQHSGESSEESTTQRREHSGAQHSGWREHVVCRDERVDWPGPADGQLVEGQVPVVRQCPDPGQASDVGPDPEGERDRGAEAVPAPRAGEGGPLHLRRVDRGTGAMTRVREEERE